MTHTTVSNVDAATLTATIDALQDCVRTCTWDADADLGEHRLEELLRCIRVCLDCADVCESTVSVITRQKDFESDVARPLLEACAVICKISGDECERHAQLHEHCRVCLQACRRCEQACRDLLGALSSS